MRNIHLVSIRRQPLRTVFFLLLLGFITFAFTARLIEYVAFEREIGNLSQFYRSIGILQPIDPVGDANVAEGVRLISSSPFVDFIDLRGRSAVVLNDLYNVDIDGMTSYFISMPTFVEISLGRLTEEEVRSPHVGLYMSDIYFTGTLVNIMNNATFGLLTGVLYEGQPRLHFLVDGIIAGYPEYVSVGAEAFVYFYPYGDYDITAILDELDIGSRYLVRAHYDQLFRQAWNLANFHRLLAFRPINYDGLYFMPLEPNEEVDFSDPALDGIWERIERNNENRRALAVTFTRDMETISSFWPDAHFFAREGRLLNFDDYLNARDYIVTQYAFAEMRGLNVGDTLTLTFRDLEATDSRFYLIRDGHDHCWRDYPTYTKDFEIVGLFDSLFTQQTMSLVNVYVPASTIPQGFGLWVDYDMDTIGTHEFSFVLTSPRVQNAFTDEYGDRLLQMGLAMRFMDNGALNFAESVDPILRNALINVIVFGIMLALVLALVVFMYLFGRRKDAAILRALGLTKAKSTVRLITPIMYIGVIGIIVGGITSWQVAMSQVEANMADIVRPEGVELLGALQPGFGVVMCAGVLVLLMIFTYIGSAITLRKPVLEQIQGAAKK